MAAVQMERMLESACPAEWQRPTRPMLTLCDVTSDVKRPVRPSRAARQMNRALFLAMAAAAAMFLVMMSVQSVRHAFAVNITAPASQTLTVHVAKGDTLWNFASRYGDPNQYILDRVDTLARANHLLSDAALRPGQTLRIPVQNPNALAALSHRHAPRA